MNLLYTNATINKRNVPRYHNGETYTMPRYFLSWDFGLWRWKNEQLYETGSLTNAGRMLKSRGFKKVKRIKLTNKENQTLDEILLGVKP